MALAVIRGRRPGDDPRPRRIDWGIVVLLLIAAEVLAVLITVVVILVKTAH